MTICSTASIQISTPTTAAIWLGIRAPIATPTTPYAAMTTNPAATVCQNCAATVTSPSWERISAILSVRVTASVRVVMTTLASASDSPLATRTRMRRGSPRYVEVIVP
jgi:hypothetical protein